MKKLAFICSALIALLAVDGFAGEGIYSDFTYITDGKSAPPVLPVKASSLLGADSPSIWVVGFVNTGTQTNIDNTAYFIIRGFTRTNFDASRWTIRFKYGTGYDQTQYEFALCEPTVDVSPLTVNGTTYDYGYKSTFYIPVNLTSVFAVAYAQPPPEDSGVDVFTNNGKEYTRRGVLNQNDYVMTDYDSTQTEFYKVNTATELTYSGNISYINTGSVTPATETSEGGYTVQSDAKFKNVTITDSLIVKGKEVGSVDESEVRTIAAGLVTNLVEGTSIVSGWSWSGSGYTSNDTWAVQLRMDYGLYYGLGPMDLWQYSILKNGSVIQQANYTNEQYKITAYNAGVTATRIAQRNAAGFLTENSTETDNPHDRVVIEKARENKGIWDPVLGVWWKPEAANGEITYYATTNVNLNAEN